MEPKLEIGFSRKILAFGRTTENDFARALLIDPDGKFDAIKLKNLEVSPEVTISMLENIITYKGQLIVYQTMTGISRHSIKNIIKLNIPTVKFTEGSAVKNLVIDPIKDSIQCRLHTTRLQARVLWKTSFGDTRILQKQNCDQ